MFNKYVDARTTVEFPDTIKIKEERAPTDDSIRLAKEYEDKITSKIVGQVVFGNNRVEFPKGQAIYIRHNPQLRTDETYICFKLNGKIHEIHLTTGTEDWLDCNRGDSMSILRVFARKVNDAIAEQIIDNGIRNREIHNLMETHA